MIRRILPAAFAVAGILAGSAFAQQKGTLTTDKDKLSYALGANTGHMLKTQGIDVDPALFLKGFDDAVGGGQLLLTQEEIHATLMKAEQELMAKQRQRMETLGTENKAAGEKFMAANKTKAGVQTLASGLQYKVITEGTGPVPAESDTVTVNYRGTLLDGTEFDSSYKRGKPATFPVKGVIRGWTEALTHMKVGSKWQLFIPPELAYGERGAGGAIPPNATLIFEVELLKIEPPKK
jgi:FKBP-type peptidyl-prolyl cis-trans isomerase FklB